MINNQIMQKLYCYADESGQDTKGKLFIVVVVVQESQNLDDLNNQLVEIENSTGKFKTKWHKTSTKIKLTYLQELLGIKELKKTIYYAIYRDSKEYSKLTALAIAESIFHLKITNYSATVIIDGLNNKEKERVRSELKKLKINYRKIRGLKDEQNSILRLADGIAGFLRDKLKNKQYISNLPSKIAKMLIQL